MDDRHDAVLNADALPEDLLADVVEVFKALSDTTRAQLIYLLTRREYNVNEISRYVSVSPSAVSHHLAKLRAARLVRTRREGNQIYYSIDDVHVGALFREALFHLDHVRRHLSDPTQPAEAQLFASNS
ncbi:MAG: helix-turn-helix transcriptional regulator [Caldilineaceae bacterium]|nr:helix-turn-helix transcriptional regulator [Caldilineaceae bacterium]